MAPELIVLPSTRACMVPSPCVWEGPCDCDGDAI